MEKSRLDFKIGRSLSDDEKTAVKEFYESVYIPGAEAIIFFCSSKYNLEILGSELANKFDCPLIGCTTAGEVSSLGYQDGGIVGASLRSSELKIHTKTIYPLSEFSLKEAEKIAVDIHSKLLIASEFDRNKMFGFILIDGLSVLEEKTIASLHTCFKNIPIIGGSAGDNLEFKKTYVYDRGKFLSNAAVFSIFETTLPFVTFMFKHFQPTNIKIVVTAACPKDRIITEINGEPAAIEYARVLGLGVDQLNSEVYAKNPLMLRIGHEWYVRSVQRCNEDNSLSLFSAIEEGLVLTLGKNVDIYKDFKNQMAQLDRYMLNNRFFIFLECVLRKIELKENHAIDDMEKLLSCINSIGFNTYGEQFNSIHVNQTLVGVVLGG